jgi:purine-binding chemotaxis protein CheW
MSAATIARPGTVTRAAQLVTFHLGDRLLGLPIEVVREILRVEDITPVPDAPAGIRGVINLRGEVVTIVDLRIVLGLDEAEIGPHTRLVVAHSNDEAIGLLVDRVADVVTIDPEEREPLPANSESTESCFFTGVHKVNGELLVGIDLAAVLAEGVRDENS